MQRACSLCLGLAALAAALGAMLLPETAGVPQILKVVVIFGAGFGVCYLKSIRPTRV